jgi:hypothetical protein
LTGTFAPPRAAAAQQPAKVARIGFLVTGSIGSPEVALSLDTVRQGLRDRGYVEGQNLVIEPRGADGKIERLPGLATELVRLKVDLILAVASPRPAPYRKRRPRFRSSRWPTPTILTKGVVIVVPSPDAVSE